MKAATAGAGAPGKSAKVDDIDDHFWRQFSDREIEQALTLVKKGTRLLKYGRMGRPKVSYFRLSQDEMSVVYFSGEKERELPLSQVTRMVRGQRTNAFLRQSRREKEDQSFSLLFDTGDKSLDVTCKDKDEADVWWLGLSVALRRVRSAKEREEKVRQWNTAASSNSNEGNLLPPDISPGSSPMNDAAGAVKGPGSTGSPVDMSKAITSNLSDPNIASLRRSMTAPFPMSRSTQDLAAGRGARKAAGLQGGSPQEFDNSDEDDEFDTESLGAQSLTTGSAGGSSSGAGAGLSWDKLQSGGALLPAGDSWGSMSGGVGAANASISRMGLYSGIADPSVYQSSASTNSAEDSTDLLGDIYMWGQGLGEGLLGGGALRLSGNETAGVEADSILPKGLESGKMLDVVGVACGERHAAIVTKNGEVFCWGEEEGGRLGLGVDRDSSQPQVVEALGQVAVEQVACGKYFTCALSRPGELYLWGDGVKSNGALADKGDNAELRHWLPKKVTGQLAGLKVCQVSCGPWHVAAVAMTGQLFTFGDGTFGALGHGSCESESSPREVHALRNLRTLHVACGVWHTAAVVEVLTADAAASSGGNTGGRLFTWGDGQKGCLGHGDVDSKLLPTPVQALPDNGMLKVACGQGLTVALSTSGKVFTMGAQKYGQLGNPHAHGRLPCQVSGALAFKHVDEIACGSNHVAVLTRTAEVFTWGRGSNGRLGHGDSRDREIPTMVEALKDRKVLMVACGPSATAVIVQHKPASGADHQVCTQCKQSFGYTRIRHSCYNCGHSFCHPCSARKLLGAAMAPSSLRPYRVCDSCHAKMTRSNSSSLPAASSGGGSASGSGPGSGGGSGSRGRAGGGGSGRSTGGEREKEKAGMGSVGLAVTASMRWQKSKTISETSRSMTEKDFEDVRVSSSFSSKDTMVAASLKKTKMESLRSSKDNRMVPVRSQPPYLDEGISWLSRSFVGKPSSSFSSSLSASLAASAVKRSTSPLSRRRGISPMRRASSPMSQAPLPAGGAGDSAAGPTASSAAPASDASVDLSPELERLRMELDQQRDRTRELEIERDDLLIREANRQLLQQPQPQLQVETGKREEVTRTLAAMEMIRVLSRQVEHMAQCLPRGSVRLSSLAVPSLNNAVLYTGPLINGQPIPSSLVELPPQALHVFPDLEAAAAAAAAAGGARFPPEKSQSPTRKLSPRRATDSKFGLNWMGRASRGKALGLADVGRQSDAGATEAATEAAAAVAAGGARASGARSSLAGTGTVGRDESGVMPKDATASFPSFEVDQAQLDAAGEGGNLFEMGQEEGQARKQGGLDENAEVGREGASPIRVLLNSQMDADIDKADHLSLGLHSSPSFKMLESSRSAKKSPGKPGPTHFRDFSFSRGMGPQLDEEIKASPKMPAAVAAAGGRRFGEIEKERAEVLDDVVEEKAVAAADADVTNTADSPMPADSNENGHSTPPHLSSGLVELASETSLAKRLSRSDSEKVELRLAGAASSRKELNFQGVLEGSQRGSVDEHASNEAPTSAANQGSGGNNTSEASNVGGYHEAHHTQKKSSRKGSDGKSSKDGKDGTDWVEQPEQGVYVTLGLHPSGGKELRRVRFSRKLFSEKEAEVWWSQNKSRVTEMYNIKGTTKKSSSDMSKSSSMTISTTSEEDH